MDNEKPTTKQLLKKLFRWQKGRQNCGYDKLLLAFSFWPIKFDCWLIKFPTGSLITEHVDQVDSGKHYRLNIILKNPKSGGDFKSDDTIYDSKRIKLFRPDLHKHSVTRINQGSRLVLSIGWVTN